MNPGMETAGPLGTRRLSIELCSAGTAVAQTSAADDLAGLQARGADVQLPHRARCHLRPHRLDVRVPPTVGPAMGVGYVHPETGTLATHVTDGSHAEHPYRCSAIGHRADQSKLEKARHASGNLTRVLTGALGTKFPPDPHASSEFGPRVTPGCSKKHRTHAAGSSAGRPHEWLAPPGAPWTP